MRRNPRRPIARLGLEVLEDRTVPSTFHVAAPVLSQLIMLAGAEVPAHVVRLDSGMQIRATDLNDLRVAAGLQALWRDLRLQGMPPPSAAGFAGAIAADSVVEMRFAGGAGGSAQPHRVVPAGADSHGGVDSAGRAEAVPIQPGTNLIDVPRPDPNPPAQNIGTRVLTRDGAAPASGPASQTQAPAPVGVPARRDADPRTSDTNVGKTTVDPRAVPQTRQEATGVPAARAQRESRSPATNGDSATSTAELPDGSLLQRFVVHREQAAFTALVQRHQQFVFSVCQRVLGDSHAAEDALQATFMILARKASMLDNRTPLVGWLYKVAYHLALRLRSVGARNQKWEKSNSDSRLSRIPTEPTSDFERQEVRCVLHEELQRLPDEYRLPLVLCYLDGQTHAEAARAMGLPRGSMAKRIGEALDVLRERLIERGLSL